LVCDVLENAPIQIQSTVHGMPILVQCATFLLLIKTMPAD
jgi:hypothetical protein